MIRNPAAGAALALALILGVRELCDRARREVADAAMRRDSAEVRRLVQSGADVKARASRRRHGAALGGLPRRRELGLAVARGRRRRCGGQPQRLDSAVARGEPGRRTDDRGAAEGRRGCQRAAPARPQASDAGRALRARRRGPRAAGRRRRREREGRRARHDRVDASRRPRPCRRHRGADRARRRCRRSVQAGLARRAHGGARQVRRSAQRRATASDRDSLRSGDSRSQQAATSSSPKRPKTPCSRRPARCRRCGTATLATSSATAWASSLPAAGPTGRRGNPTAASSRRSSMRPAPAASTPRACCSTPAPT